MLVVSSLQGLPVHLTKEEPSPAVAVKITGAFRLYCSSQSPGAVYMTITTGHRAGSSFFKVVTTLSLLGPWKTALTVFFLSMVTVQGSVPSHPKEAGFHPRKRWRGLRGRPKGLL